jgi:FtsZ-binding cell division protein ZapB
LIRRLRREVEEYKLKAQIKDQEAEDLRISRDKLRDEKNDNLLKYSK